ncbi:MAG: acyl carrier protein [Desulfobacterales bacterium]|nr:acyl carrier protein [Desulfobacterales bacterium]
MTREEIKSAILNMFKEIFEIDNPGLDDNLREMYQFDSIDAIELIREIERLVGSELNLEEKDQAMGIRTINQIIMYVESLFEARSIRVN